MRIAPILLVVLAACSSPPSNGSGGKTPLLYQSYEAIDRRDWPGFERLAEEARSRGGSDPEFIGAMGALYLAGAQRSEDIQRRSTYLAKACVDLEKALEARADTSAVAINLAVAHRMAGRVDTAITVLEGLARRRPDDPAAARMMAECYQAKDDPAGALRAIRRVSMAEESASDLEIAGMCLYQMSRFDEAEKSYRAALAREPENARIWHNLAVSLQDAGKPDEAKKAYETERKLREKR